MSTLINTIGEEKQQTSVVKMPSVLLVVLLYSIYKHTFFCSSFVCFYSKNIFFETEKK